MTVDLHIHATDVCWFIILLLVSIAYIDGKNHADAGLVLQRVYRNISTSLSWKLNLV